MLFNRAEQRRVFRNNLRCGGYAVALKTVVIFTEAAFCRQQVKRGLYSIAGMFPFGNMSKIFYHILYHISGRITRIGSCFFLMPHI